MAFAIGLGGKTESHIHFNLLSAGNHPANLASIPGNLSENLTSSLDFMYLHKKWFKWEGEFAHSENKKEASGLNANLNETYYQASNPFNFLDKSAWRTSVSLLHEKSNSTFTSEVKNIGASYYSVGVPFLRNNFISYKLKLKKQFFKKQVALETTWNHENNSPTSSTALLLKTNTNSLGANLSLTFRKLPYLIVSYLPFSQDNKLFKDSFGTHTYFEAWSVISGYQAYFDGVVSNTQILYMRQKERSIGDTYSLDRKSISATEVLKLRIPLQLTASFGYYFPEITINPKPAKMTQIAFSYAITKKCEPGAGFECYFNFINGSRRSLYGTLAYKISSKQQLMMKMGVAELASLSDGNKEHKVLDGYVKYYFLF